MFNSIGNDKLVCTEWIAAFLFLGLAIILYKKRSEEDIDRQQSISLGMIFAIGGLALLGVFEYIRQFVGFGVFLAIAAESFICINYFLIYLKTNQTVLDKS